MIGSLMYELMGNIARRPRLIVHICLSILIYQSIRFLFGVSWITYWHPLLIIMFLISYVGLSLYLKRKIVSTLSRIIEEDFDIREIPEMLKHLGEACIFDDIKGRISRKFVLTAIIFLLSYYTLLVLAVSVIDHYSLYYGGPPILAVLFDTYATYMWSALIGVLFISAYLAYVGYAESGGAHKDVFSEWIEGLIEDYIVNNCLRRTMKGRPSRALVVLTPLMLIPKKELLRTISIPPLPRTLAVARLKAIGSSKSYSIEPLKRDKRTPLPEALIPKDKAVTIEDLEKGILQHLRVAKIYWNENNKKELLGYMITFTEKLEAARIIITRHFRDGLFVCKPEEAVTHIYLLALHPRMVNFYMDLWLLSPNKKPGS